VPDAPFVAMRDPGTYLAKAFDDRLGCALLIELMETFASRPHPNTLVAAATVQEEPLTERGAASSLELARPDLAIILEGAPAEDTPDQGEDGPVRLGGGPGLSMGDDGVVLNPRLRDFVADVAESSGIPLQRHVLEGGHTDGMVIQQHRGGVPVVTLGVPMRYAHCHSGIMKRGDYDATLRLLQELVLRLDAGTVQGLAAWTADP
jgi:putative aminopeptidase FrvX